MLNLGTDEIIKYPFLAEAKAYLKDKGFTLEQFVNDPDHKFIIDIAYDRIKYAANGKIYPPIYNNDDINTSSFLPREIFSFIIAVVLLKMSRVNILIKKFALSEARRAEKYLEKDLEAKIDIHSDNIRKQLEHKTNQQELAIKIIKELFSVEIQKNNDHFIIAAQDYLKHAVHFHETEWKLVNRYLSKGFVYLTPHETVRLLRRKIDQYISSRIYSIEIPSIQNSLRYYINNITLMAKKFSIPSFPSSGEYPPCIKHTLAMLENGKNLSHSGRFLLATFLLSKKKPMVEIISLFKNAPDYNPKTTLYQINHLAGLSGSRIKYNCPSCQKIKTHNLCFATSECNNISTPLQFKGNNEST